MRACVRGDKHVHELLFKNILSSYAAVIIQISISSFLIKISRVSSEELKKNIDRFI